ncbi:MAG: hypothetical protein ACFFA6_07510 [Promethearchaeota archaeon]
MIKTKIKNREIKISLETRNFIVSTSLAMFVTYILTFIDVWQLIIIPGILAGAFNKTIRRGIYSGALGVAIIWFLFMLYSMIVQDAYTNLDQFAGLIFGGLGYGWVIFILILLFGVLFGALGGAIGSSISILVKLRFETDESELSKPKTYLKSNRV